MTSLPTHPALVHVPLGLAFVVPIVALALLVAAWRGAAGRRAFALLALLQALLVVGGLVALRAGQRDEQRAEAVVPEGAIDAHEERAEAFLWAAGVVLAGALAVTVLPRRATTAAAALVAAGSLAVGGLALRAGEAGGELVYRYGAAMAYAGGATPGVAAPGRAARGDDD